MPCPYPPFPFMAGSILAEPGGGQARPGGRAEGPKSEGPAERETDFRP